MTVQAWETVPVRTPIIGKGMPGFPSNANVTWNFPNWDTPFQAPAELRSYWLLTKFRCGFYAAPQHDGHIYAEVTMFGDPNWKTHDFIAVNNDMTSPNADDGFGAATGLLAIVPPNGWLRYRTVAAGGLPIPIPVPDSPEITYFLLR